MPFRDQRQALQDRAEALEQELEDVRRERDALEDEVEGKEALEARVRELEKELGKLRPEKRKREPVGGAGNLQKKAIVAVAMAALVAAAVFAFQLVSREEKSGDVLTGLPIDAHGAPTIGMVDLQRTLDPMPVQSTARGTIDADDVKSGCEGFVSESPDLVVRTTQPMHVWLSTRSSSDLVMVVVTEDGAIHCDDDSGDNQDPRIDLLLAPGDHRVWVGTYSANEQHPFSLEVRAQPADAVPDETGLASRGAPSLGTFAPDADHRSGTWETSTRGVVEASDVEATCQGWLTVGPQLLITLSEPMAVRVRTQSAQDTVLLIRDSDGNIRCDDDSGDGKSALIAGIYPEGELRVWAGSYDDGLAEYTLVAEAVPTDASPHPSGLGVGVAATLGSIEAASGQFPGVARGFTPLAPVVEGCSGYAPIAPHFDMRLDEARDVVLHATGADALTVVVLHPDGAFDCGTSDGRIRGMWRPGLHKIWIGVAGPEQESEFTLDVQTSAPSIRPWTPNQ